MFQDGVRINEAFGDVVNWDLLPPIRDLQRAAHSRLESGLRAQHAGRSARDLHPKRCAISWRRDRAVRRIVRTQDRRTRIWRQERPARLLCDSQFLRRARVGGAQPEPHQAVLRQARLPGRSYRYRREPHAGRQHTAGNADAAAVVGRHADAGVHLSRHQRESPSVRHYQGQPFPERIHATRGQRLLPPLPQRQHEQQRQ